MAIGFPPMYSTDFPSRFPETISGVIRISASPATSETMPFFSAAYWESALSNANGPSIMHPFIWPLSHIFLMIAAFTVSGISIFTTSTAQSSATFGILFPNLFATETAFSISFISVSKSGLITTPPSEISTIFSRSSYVDSKAAILVRMRSVRSPHSLFSTALRSVAVFTEPFRSTPSLFTICTASLHFSSSSLESIISLTKSVVLNSFKIFSIFFLSPTNIPSPKPVLYASATASMASLSSPTTTIGFLPMPLRCSKISLKFLNIFSSTLFYQKNAC